MIVPDPAMVMITWLDSQLTEERWQPFGECSLELRAIKSVGWLIGETDLAYAIAQDVDLDEPEGPWANTVGTIPKGAVVTIERLGALGPRLEVA